MASGEGGVKYRSNALRGPANALGLAMGGGFLERWLAERKRRVFADLPKTVLEIGPGIGANFRYMEAGTTVLAVEPNPAMHAGLVAAAKEYGIALELHRAVGESLGIPDGSVPMVVSSLVLCTVQKPSEVVAEILRVLQAGGRYAFVEHVAATSGSRLRRLQHAIRAPGPTSLRATPVSASSPTLSGPPVLPPSSLCSTGQGPAGYQCTHKSPELQ